MIRALILVPCAALALAGCSKSAATADAAATTASSKPNPWSSGGAMPAGDPQAAAAPAPAADAASKHNPWAKDGAAASAPPAPADQTATK